MTKHRESFASVPNGAIPIPARVEHYWVDSAAAEPWARNGFLSTKDPSLSQAGTYRIVSLGEDVVRIGARFAFTPWTAEGGVMCLSIQQTSIAHSPAVPISPLHLQVTPTSWTVDLNDTAGTGVEPLASGPLPRQLVADGATIYSAEAVLDRDRGRCYLWLPGGLKVTLSDPRFRLKGSYAYVEPFRMPSGAPTARTAALIREWWADTSAEDMECTRDRAGTPIVAASFSSGWSHTPNNQPVAYSRTGKTVTIIGVGSGPGVGEVMRLPADFQPDGNRHFAISTSGGVGDLLVTSDGRVILTSGGTAWASFECSFDARA